MLIQDLLKDLEDISNLYAQKYDIDRSSDWYALKLAEELGEVMQSYLKLTKRARTAEKDRQTLKEELEDELADVIGMALLMAKDQDIDIEQAIQRKWLKHHSAPRSAPKFKR